MQRLTAGDAMFLYMENATNYGHVGGLQILDAPAVPKPRTPEEDEAHMEHFLQTVPFARKKLAEVPLGFGHPFWVDDADFDLEYHWRRTAIPGEGTPEDVERVISRLAARHLDRRRPLWEFHEVENIDGGQRSGIYTKIHHAAADGAAMMALAMATMTMTPDIVNHPMPETPWRPEPNPPELQLLTRSALEAAGRPRQLVSWARRTAGELIGQFGPEGLFRSNFSIVRDQMASIRAPKTRFNAPLTPHRRWAYGSTPLDEVKAIRKATGATVNDIVLCICAQMLRDWLDERGELPDESLVAMVPVNLRDGEATTSDGNMVSAVPGRIHTEIADPVERLEAIHASMNAQKEMQKAVPADLQMDTMGIIPAWALANATRLAFRTRAGERLRPFNLTISNVPGPQFPLYVDGAQQLASYPYSTVADGVGLNITVTSYNGNLDWGIVVDRGMVEDAWSMWDGLQKAQAALLATI